MCFLLRLCLVRVKAFSENILFSGNATFRKGKCFHMFGCISKKFLKNIFWCLEKKEKTNPEKHGQNPGKKSSTIDAWLGSTERCFTSSSSTTVPSIVINDAISRRRDRDRRRDLAKARRSRSMARSWIAVVGLELARSVRTGAQGSPTIVELDWSSIFFLSRALSLSLSLSLFPEILWSENESVKWFP